MSILKKLLTENKEDSEERKSKITKDGIFIPVRVGDVILRGRFRNRKVVVKEIKINEHGLPEINGSNITNFRLGETKEERENE